MTMFQTPAPARSDLATASPRESGAHSRPFVRHGLLLAGGALAWAAAMVLFGLDPQGSGPIMAYAVGSGVFQLGLLALLRVLWCTDALGSGRIAKAALVIETVLVTLAIGSTAADGIGVSDLSQPAWALLDAFWPISMLGMFFIGIRIAIAGRWRGAYRFWPLVAESWAPVTIGSLMILGPGVAAVVGPAHLLTGYAVLGLLVATKSNEPV